jgi:MFS family permease
VAHNEINSDFGVSDEYFPHSYWPTASWGVGGAIFPLLLFPIMEDFGVRRVLIGTYSFFVLMLIPVGVAPNFATLIVTRFFTGGCVQLLSNAVASIISNVFRDDNERSLPICLYVTVYLTSTSIGPVIGASILEHLGWRWIGFVELIWTACLLPVFAIALPESRGSVILQKRAQTRRRQGQTVHTAADLRRTSLGQVLASSVYRPLYMLFTEPVAIFASLWAAFSLGTIYMFTQSAEQVFGALYQWTTIQSSYIQAAIVLGELLGYGLCAYSNKWYYASADRNKETPGLPIPEARLYPAIIGSVFGVTGGMLVYGWTPLNSASWVAPAFGLGMVGLGTTTVIVGNANYLIDAYSHYAASALGAVGLVENLAIAFLPLATTAMYSNLGFGWASSLLALSSLLLASAPIALLAFGPRVRASSPFMRDSAAEKLALMTFAQAAEGHVREIREECKA